MQHLTRIDELAPDSIQSLFQQAKTFADGSGDPQRRRGRIVATLFYEPSTRTRLSFESAALRLGAQCLGFSDPAASSVSKGETLVDTIRTVQRYADVIVLRHPAEGAATLAAKVAKVPIINAGDGGHEHPTQTLFDLYTIWQHFGDLADRRIGFVGDLRYGRTVHSLASAAAQFNMPLSFIAPEQLQMPAHLLTGLQQRTQVQIADRLDDALAELDVLYVTRLQRERIEGAAADVTPLRITPELLRRAHKNMLILHPLPRVDEIDPLVDEDPRAAYFEQAANGVVMRMALLDTLLDTAPALPLGASTPQRYDDPPWQPGNDTALCPNPRCVSNTERNVQPRWQKNDSGCCCAYCDALQA